MIAGRLNQIFWGLILVIVDVTIGGFDVLPDFIGYTLMAVGAGGLRNISSKFGVAGALSWLLLVLSVIGWIASTDRASGDLQTALSYITMVVDCIMIWNLLGGVMVYAEARARPDLAASASARRVLYVVVMGVVLVVGHTVMDQGSSGLAVVLVLIMLIVVFMVLHLIRCVRREIALIGPMQE